MSAVFSGQLTAPRSYIIKKGGVYWIIYGNLFKKGIFYTKRNLNKYQLNGETTKVCLRLQPRSVLGSQFQCRVQSALQNSCVYLDKTYYTYST